MADQSIIRSAAQSFAVLSYNDTPIYPTPSDPLDPPEQPQPPEQNDGAGDVEENAPPSPQDETMRKARKDRAPNKKAIAIAEHVRKWLTKQMEQERKEFEAIWLGKGDVLSSSDDARNLTETIVAKTGFVVPAGDVRAWLTAFTGLPRALDWIYKHDHRTPQPTSDSPPRPRTTSTTFPTPTPPPLLKGPSPLTLLVLATTLTSQIGSRKSSAKSWGVIRPTWYNQRTRLRFLRCGLEVARQEGGAEAREVQPSLAGRRSGGMAQTAPNGE